jgi:hypothetical protein
MRLPKRPRNFDDLFDRIIFEQDGESAIGNAFSKFGSSVSDTMKKAYNLTADPLGLGADLKPDRNSELFKSVKGDEVLWSILNKIQEKYSSDANLINNLKNKPLILKSKENVIFNVADWKIKTKLTPITLTVNKNNAYLNDPKIYNQFYTSFLDADMNRPDIDPEFLKVVMDCINEFLKEKYNVSTPALSGGTSTPPVITPEIQSKINLETPELKNKVFNSVKNIKLKLPKPNDTKSYNLYLKVFYTFTSNRKGSLLF